jgi:hypothetical protein
MNITTMRTILMHRNRKWCAMKSKTPGIAVYIRRLTPDKTKCIVTYARDRCLHCKKDCSNNFHYFEVGDFIEQEIDDSHTKVVDQLFVEEANNMVLSDIDLLNLLNDC